MKRLLWIIPLLLVTCATAPDTRDEVPGAHVDEIGVRQELPASASRSVIAATVVESVIQRDRVVVTLDRGTADGIRPGMSGTMANGRPFKVISADQRTCRVVVVGLNLRFSAGSDAFIDK